MVWDKTASEPDLLSDGQNTYIYGPGGLPIQQISPSGTNTYLHHDQLGSTRLITSSAGSNVASYNFDAYGKQLAKTGSATTPLGYAGQYTDAESGLIYMRARYYDPATGTFISKDPIGSAGSGQNHYGYVSGDPTNAVDPSGLWGMWLSDIAAGLLNGATGGYLEKLLGLDPSCAGGWGRTAGDLLSWAVPLPGKFVRAGSLATNASRRSSPFLRHDPYSPESVSKRQSARRAAEGVNRSPDTPLPDRAPGRSGGGHSSDRGAAHPSGERNVGNEEHSRVAKGSGGRGPRGSY